MVSVLQSIFMVIFGIEFIIGILGNGFIALVNCIDWIKKQKISLIDQILTALVISRLFLLIIMIPFIGVFDPFAPTNAKKMVTLANCGAVANHFSVWLAMILSLFYCLKIANFLNPVFLYLKRRVRKVVMVMLLALLIFLFVNLLMLNLFINIKMDSFEGNMTWSSKRSVTETFLKLTMFSIGYLIPFSVSSIFFLLLIFSLWKHLRNMKLSAARSRDPSTKAHVTAMKTVVSFLFLFAVYFLCLLPTLWTSRKSVNALVLSVCDTLAIVYPSVHSFIFILGNSKLRKASLLVLWQLRYN